MKFDERFDLVCQKCGKNLKYSNIFEKYICTGKFCSYETDEYKANVNPDIYIKLGKTKLYGKMHFNINSLTGEFYIIAKRGFNITYYGPFHFNDINLEVSSKTELIYKTSKGSIPVIVSGMLFGSLGAVAGSLVANTKQKITSSDIYNLTLSIDDISFPGFRVEIKDYNKVYFFVNVIENIRKKFNKEESIVGKKNVKNDTQDSVNESTNEIYDILSKIKYLYDHDVLTDEEYKIKRQKYADKLQKD